MRSVDVKSIGAGGGSIAWIDPGGLLRVGPQSAGADPGPACYGRGGTQPTVTDARSCSARSTPTTSSAGGCSSTPTRRGDAIDARRRRAARAGRSRRRHTAALTIASENIVGAIREITIAQGIDPREVDDRRRRRRLRAQHRPDRARARLRAGAAAAHRGRAVGLRRAVRGHHLRVLAQPLRGDAHARLGRGQRGARRDRGARRTRSSTGWTTPSRVATRKEFFVEARYRSQVWELDVPLAARGSWTTKDVAALEEAFHAYARAGLRGATSRASTSSACSGRRARLRCSPSRTCARASSPPRATDGAGRARATAYFRRPGARSRAAATTARACPGRAHRRPGDHPGADDDGRRLSGLDGDGHARSATTCSRSGRAAARPCRRRAQSEAAVHDGSIPSCSR